MEKRIKKILIIGSSKLPCPATKGGAVPILTEQILKIFQKRNEEKFRLDCCSVYDKKAELFANEKYAKTSFIWIHDSPIALFLDSIIGLVLKVFRLTKYINSLSFFFRIQSRKNKIRKILLKKDYDLVVFENSLLILKTLSSKKILKKYKGKFFYHSHSVPHNFYGAKEILKKSAGIISVSEYLSTYYQFAYQPNGVSKKIVVKNCVDLDLFNNRNCRNSFFKKMSIPEDSFVLLYVGRITENKGVLEIINALKNINDKNIYLVICGSSFYKKGSKTSFVKKVIKEAEPIKTNIVFTGYIDNNDLPTYYSSCDVLISPSHCQEAAGLMNIEAMACGLPSITTNDGGITEYVNNKTSLIINLDDGVCLDKKISECILKLKNDRKLLNDMKINCLKKANEFDASLFYDSFFKEIL